MWFSFFSLLILRLQKSQIRNFILKLFPKNESFKFPSSLENLWNSVYNFTFDIEDQQNVDKNVINKS